MSRHPNDLLKLQHGTLKLASYPCKYCGCLICLVLGPPVLTDIRVSGRSLCGRDGRRPSSSSDSDSTPFCVGFEEPVPD